METNNFLFFLAALLLGSHALARTPAQIRSLNAPRLPRSIQARPRAVLPSVHKQSIPPQSAPRRSSLKGPASKKYTQKHVAISPSVAIKRYDPEESPQDTARREIEIKFPPIKPKRVQEKPRWMR